MVYISIIITHILNITNHAGPLLWAAIHVVHSGHIHTMMVFKFELLNFLFSQKLINSCPCQDLNPGPPRWQAVVLTM